MSICLEGYFSAAATTMLIKMIIEVKVSISVRRNSYIVTSSQRQDCECKFFGVASLARVALRVLSSVGASKIVCC